MIRVRKAWWRCTVLDFRRSWDRPIQSVIHDRLLLAELDKPDVALIKNHDLLTSGEAARAAFDFRQERKAARLAANAQNEAEKQQAKEAGSPEDKQPAQQNNAAKPNPGPGVPQQIYLEESKARLETALAATQVSLNVSYGSGPTIFVSQPTKEACDRFAVRTSAKQSVRM